MAVYQLLTSWMSVSDMCKIISTEQRDGFTIYIIEVVVSPYHWTVNHRYSEFRDLHDKLVAQYDIDRSLLPPKKIFGNQSEVFIQKRQADLELYLHSVIHQIPKLSLLLAEFLDFPNYEVHYIMEKLAETLFIEGDKILQADSFFMVTPLELNALTERLKLPEPTCSSGDKKRDLGHILDFVSQLKHLRIQGSKEPVLNSNIIPNHLKFDLTPFKSLKQLNIENCNNLRGKLLDLSSVRSSVSLLSAHESLDDLGSLIVGDLIHWSIADDLTYWPWWHRVQTADLSRNNINSIDPCIRLLKNLENLDLSHNAICSVENMESLPSLSNLNLSHNRITHLDAMHTRLGNIRSLDLSENSITSLQGLSKLYSLVQLDLGENQVTNLRETTHVATLPCLEILVLKGNPLTTAVDYRAHALMSFGSRAGEIILDGKAVSQKELDTVSVLQALQAAREGKQLRRSSMSDSSRHKVEGSPVLFPGEGRVGGGVEPESSQFRQQVAALRRLGGTDWLRLFNRFQKEQESQQPEGEFESPYPDLKNILDINSLCDTTVGCYFATQDISGNVLIPEWISSLSLSNSAFRSTVLKTISSYELQQESETKSSVPIWSVWGLILWRHKTICVKIPAVIILCSDKIYILKLDNLICNVANCDDDEDDVLLGTCSKELPQPVLSTFIFILPPNIKHLKTGTHGCYAEMQLLSSDGLQIVNFFLPNLHELLGKLKSQYGVPIKEKYSRGEFEEASSNALITHSSKGGVMLSNRIVQVMCCELVCKMKLEDHVKQSQLQNLSSFLIVTPELVVLLEESLSRPTEFSNLRFKVVMVFDVRSDVHSIQMKDSGSTSHTCCCHENEKSQKGKKLKGKCCLLHELYTCGFWLLVDFEGSSSLKVRFTSREARSRFLEAFLAARNHIT